MRILVGLFFAWFAWFVIPAAGRADSPVHSYALVVGSNKGGSGQSPLRFAEYDAERMAELFVELGRTPAEQVSVLTQPSAAELSAALERLRVRTTVHAERGERSQVLFYYSGHARARALSLGDEELSLASLRRALMALPSTLTVVVLDACQSGAFSGVKGAEPAADFSLSSVNDLHSEGIAVMASSTAEELSQESPELASSYFSHHLVVALRGAGDGNGDGRVSLDEAYGYAYQHTLSDTARTQVGTQHATLETDIRGRGTVPLTYPVDADAQLLLPRELDGRVLVQKAKERVVIAEILKAQGAPLALALPSGDYEVLVRDAEKAEARSCRVTLTRGASHALDAATCPIVTTPSSAAKSAHGDPLVLSAKRAREAARRNERERWFFEGGVVFGSAYASAFTGRLQSFGYGENNFERYYMNAEFSAGVGLNRHFTLVARSEGVENRNYERYLGGVDGRGSSDQFYWSTIAVALGLRARLRFFREWIVGFAELDGGLGIAFGESYGTSPDGRTHESSETRYGPVVRGALGMTFGFSEHFGAYMSTAYTYAPVQKNDLGDTHDDGGFSISTGLRLRSLKGFW